MSRLLPLLLLAGCLPRYAAPTDPVPADEPYYAVAAMQRIAVPEGDGAPLPAAARRLAIGPEPGRVLLDGALLGNEGATTTGPGEGDAVAEQALAAPGPLVVVLDATLLDAWCPRLGDALLAVDAGGEQREPADGLSQDRLGGAPAATVCAAAAPEPASPPE